MTNEQLEQQSRQLRASEEELRVQSEELQVTNEEMKAKSDILEQQKTLLEKLQQETQDKADDLAHALRDAFSAGGPRMVVVRVDPEVPPLLG